MKILICTGIFPPEAGGPATYSKLLAEELSKRGHEVTLITYGKEYQISSIKYQIIFISRSFFKPWHYWKYFRAVKKHGRDADVIYAQDPVSAGYPTYLAAKVLKKRFAVKITGDYSWEQAMNRRLTDKLIDDFQQEKNLPRPIAKMRDIQIRVAKEATTVVVPSEYLKRIVLGWGVKEKRVRVIYNSVSMPATIAPAAKPAGKFLIVSSGRDVPWKGFETLKQAVEELGEDYELRIVHSMPHNEYLRVLKSADVFVLNTGYEGFAHAIIEAMAVGTLVITTRVGGNVELVNDGETGLLVDYNGKDQIKAAIKKLYDSPELRAKLVENARKSLDKFSLKNMVDETERILKECVS